MSTRRCADVLQITMLAISMGLLCSSLVLAEDIVIRDALIRVVEQADVPALDAGQLVELNVTPGTMVQQGQLLGRLDARSEELQLRRAEVELEIARRDAEYLGLVELADNALQQALQAAEEHTFLKRILRLQAENPLKVQAAAKQLEVARNELDRVQRAREGFAKSVSDSEIDARKLAAGHAELSHQQAQFEQQVDTLKAEAEELAARSKELKVVGARVDKQGAEHKQNLNKLAVEAQQNAVREARLKLEQRAILSPLSGAVVEVKPHVGEWVQPGMTVMRVINLNILRAEGFVPVSALPRLRLGQPLQIQLQAGNASDIRCVAKLTFVSPEVDPVNQEVRIWAEFENPEGRFLPGMRPSLLVNLSP